MGWITLFIKFRELCLPRTKYQRRSGMLKFSDVIPADGYDEAAVKLLRKLYRKWKREDITFHRFTVGLTNTLFGCSLGGDESTMVLFRVYGEGTDRFIDRDNERNNMLCLHRAGMAAPVYAAFSNGLVYGYQPGYTVDRSSVRLSHIYPLVAAAMARFHRVTPPGDPRPQQSCIWPQLDKFLALTPDKLTDPAAQIRFETELRSVAELRGELRWLRGELEAVNSPLVMCHNDTLLNNFVISPENDLCTLIDLEYGGPNHQAFDIGNHFAEFPGTEDVDYSFYPDRKFQLSWLHCYLDTFRSLQPSETPTKLDFYPPVTDDDVEKLYVQVNKFALLSHFFWGVWSLVQARFSKIDFDFVDYAIVRFNEYDRRKQEFASLTMPSAQ